MDYKFYNISIVTPIPYKIRCRFVSSGSNFVKRYLRYRCYNTVLLNYFLLNSFLLYLMNKLLLFWCIQTKDYLQKEAILNRG